MFRTLRAVQGKALHWPLHYLKLAQDCAIISLVCPAEALLRAELEQVLAKNPEGVIKLIVTRGESARGYLPNKDAVATRIWDCFAMPNYPAEWATQGIKAQLCSLRLSLQPRLAAAKHLNRLENVLAAAELECSGAAEGLMLDSLGHLIEGTRSNLFLVSQGQLLTPDLQQCGVSGIQRGRVMAFASQQGIALKVGEIGLEQALQADELFLVSSIMGVWPIREFEQHRWQHFPYAAKIRHGLERMP